MHNSRWNDAKKRFKQHPMWAQRKERLILTLEVHWRKENRIWEKCLEKKNRSLHEKLEQESVDRQWRKYLNSRLRECSEQKNNNHKFNMTVIIEDKYEIRIWSQISLVLTNELRHWGQYGTIECFCKDSSFIWTNWDFGKIAGSRMEDALRSG